MDAADPLGDVAIRAAQAIEWVGSQTPGDLADRLPVTKVHPANLAHQSHGDRLLSRHKSRQARSFTPVNIQSRLVAMKEHNLSKSEMARHMDTSRP